MADKPKPPPQVEPLSDDELEMLRQGCAPTSWLKMCGRLLATIDALKAENALLTRPIVTRDHLFMIIQKCRDERKGGAETALEIVNGCDGGVITSGKFKGLDNQPQPAPVVEDMSRHMLAKWLFTQDGLDGLNSWSAMDHDHPDVIACYIKADDILAHLTKLGWGKRG